MVGWPLDLAHEHFQRRRAAFPLGPVQPRDLAQNDLRRAASLLPGLALPVTGGFRFEPVAALYFLRPFAVRPPPCFTLSFSPLPTLRLGPLLRFFAAIGLLCGDEWKSHYFFLRRLAAASRRALFQAAWLGAPLLPGFRGVLPAARRLRMLSNRLGFLVGMVTSW